MAYTWYVTPSAIEKMVNGDLDMNTGTFRVDLIETGHDLNTDFENTDYNRDDVTGICNDSGYAYATATITTGLDTTNNRVEVYMADGLTFGTSTTDARGAILYKWGGTDATSPIVAVCDFDSAVTCTNGTITMNQSESDECIFYFAYSVPTFLT